jgi:hypothetical protein
MKINRRDIAPFCECGCGGRVKWHKKKKCWNRYIYGHSNKGKKIGPCSEKTKEKLSKKMKGKYIGCKHPMYGKHHSEKTKKHWSTIRKGISPPNKGVAHLEETKIKMKEKRKLQVFSEEAKINMSIAQTRNWDGNFIRRENQSERMRGENHPNFQGWISRLPYSLNWSKELKEQIRERDGYICQLCFISQDELKKKLDVHHIDYDKKNCAEENLISLCTSCHMKTGYNREKWQSIFASQ